MALSIEQSLVRHHEELTRRGLVRADCEATPAAVHAELVAPHRRRRWMRTYRAELPQRAFDEALGEHAEGARQALANHTRSSLRVMPSWWSVGVVSMELSGPSGVRALDALSAEARGRVETIAVRDRTKDATASFEALAHVRGLEALARWSCTGA